MATGADFRLPQTEGRRPRGFAWSTRYVDLLFPIANRDLAVRTRISEVINMLRPMAGLFAPWIVGRVILEAVRRRIAPPAPPPSPPALPPADAIADGAA